ncbi:MAG: protoporphyrinogen oxidase HemJ [Proteobacteria bacterium]|nr:protoporphyrinogen oxidase HemJ [Pseudomonadota bacterium]
MTGYLWIKALHIIGVVCWFAGLFYMPRLFVYHSTTTDQIGKDRFKVMERKLYRVIMDPSMAITLIFGVWALIERWSAFSTQIWVWLKIVLVVGLIGYHHYCGKIIKAFAADTSRHSERFYRVFNEIPAVVLILIVILVVVKPF